MELIDTIISAELIREQYELYAIKSCPYSIDFYISMISSYTEYKIQLKQAKETTQWKSHIIRGKLHRTDLTKLAKIFICRQKKNKGDQNGVTFCEHRFIAVKEASHLLIDDKKTYTKHAESLIENLLFNGPHTISDMPEEYQSEVHAIICALELLFPWEERTAWKELIDSNRKSYMDAATHFKIPARWVFWVLSDKAHPALFDARSVIERIKNIKPTGSQ